MKYFKPELFDNKSNVTITIKGNTSCKTWFSAQSRAQRENLFIIAGPREARNPNLDSREF